MKVFTVGLILSVFILTVVFANVGRKSESSQSPKFSSEETSLSPNSIPEMKNPRLVVKKKERRLELFDGEKLIKTYKVGLGFAPDGDKEKQGDGKTPEGEFYIFTKNPQSKFYLSLGVSYPNIEDAERGLREKLITKTQRNKIVEAIKNKKTPLQNTRLGGEIYIHGGGNSEDWTWGCVALENEEIKELFDALPVGTAVKIKP